MSDGDISINLRLEDKDFSVTVRNAGRLLSELRQNLNTTATGARAAEKHFGSFTTQLRHTVMAMASIRFALMDIHDVFLQLPKAILKSTGEVERMTKLMEGLSKETDELRKKQEAANNTKFVFNLAQNAPFEVKALSDAFIKLKIAGLDPTNGSLQTLADSIARFGGTSEHMHRASVAIQQMVGKGVISMEELRQQLGEAMPTAMQAMAKGTGLSMSDLVNKISKGTVEAKSALERMFAVLKTENDGAALKMMDSYVGQIEKLKTSWTIFANEIGQSGGFAKEITEQLKEINELFAAAESKKFAHELSSGLATAVRGIADLIVFLRKYSDEISTIGRVLLAVWGGTKLLSMFKGLETAVRSFSATYIGGMQAVIEKEKQRVVESNVAAQSEILNQRRRILAEATANAEKIRQNAAAAATELAQNRAKHAALEAEGNAYRARYAIADQIATTKRLTNGRFASAAEVANQRALATAYFERAMAAERMAVQIKASEASLLATSTGTMAALRANTAAAAAQMAALGTAATVTASKTTVLRGALGLLGGPIGIITTLLTAGVFAWFQWGRSAEEAAQRAADAIKRAKDGYASLEDAAEISKRIATLETEIAQKQTALKNPNLNSLPDPERARNKIRELIAEQQKELKEAQAQLANATRQGNEFAIQEATRIVDQRVQGIIAAQKSGNNRLIEEERKDLAARLEAGKITKEQHYKEEVALTRKLATQNAQAEINAIKSQKAIVEKHIADMQSGAETGGVNSARFKGYERQLESLSTALRNAEGSLASALKIGTESEYVKKGGGDKKKGQGSMILSLIEQAKGDLAAAAIKLDDLADGVISFQRLRDAMLAEIEGDIKAGRIKGADEKTKVELADLRARLNQRKAEIAAESKLIDVSKGVEDELGRSISRLTNGDNYEAESAGLKNLKDKLADIQRTLVEGTPAAEKFREVANSLVGKQALADLNNFAADLSKANAEIEANLEQTERGRQQKRYDAEIKELKNAFEKRRQAILADTKLTADQRADAELRAQAALNENLRLREEEHMRKMRTPLQQLADDWKDIAGQMEQASARWADQTIDLLMELTTTGKANFKDFAVSILKDIARIQMKESLGGAITGVIGGATNWLTGVISGASLPSGKDASAGAAAGQAVTGVFGTIADAGKRLWTSLTGASDAADQQTASTGNLLSGIAAQIFQTTTKTTAESAATFAMTNLTLASNSAAQALWSVTASAGGSSSAAGGLLGGIVSSAVGYSGGGGGGGATTVPGFSAGDLGSGIRLTTSANGNIMTDMGPLALKKYARGGIAKTPQLSLFGEGSMPEAYVPLPDGRTIPVTLSGVGGGGDNVVINIVVNNNGAEGGGSESSQTSSGQEASFYKNMANQIKGIVVEQLVVQQRPGGVLYRG